MIHDANDPQIALQLVHTLAWIVGGGSVLIGVSRMVARTRARKAAAAIGISGVAPAEEDLFAGQPDFDPPLPDPDELAEVAEHAAANADGAAGGAASGIMPAPHDAPRAPLPPPVDPNAPAPPGVPVTPAVIRAPLWVRLGTLIALAFAIFLPAYFGPVSWSLAVLTLVALGLGEFWDMLDAVETPPHRTLGWAAGLILPITALVWGAGGLGPAMVAGLLCIAAGTLFVEEEAALNARMGGTALGVLYVGLLGAHLVLIGQDGGFGAIVFFVMVVQLADVGGLMTGVLFGKRKLAPSISPGKTLEGAIGSFLAAAFGAWAFAFALPTVPLNALFAVGVALAAAGLIGDLLASGFKRGAGLKDFGKVLPGHGGVLDRFDGYLFAAPIFWAWLVLMRWMGWM